jgi:serine/threonine-protein kinase RsbW
MMFLPRLKLEKKMQMNEQIILFMTTIVTLTLQADLRYLRIASVTACNVAEIFANSTCCAANIAEFSHAYELSVSEAFTNSVRYAESSQQKKQVTIRFSSDDSNLAVSIIDTNQQFNPVTQPPDIDSYPEGGYGLFLINQLMDTVSYSRQDDTNMLTMTKQVTMTNTANS